MHIKEVDPFVAKVLGNFYKPEAILTRTFNEVGDPKDNLFKATFIFPTYDRVLAPLDHVSGVQMLAALYEAGYLAMARAIRNNTVSLPVSYQEFISREDSVVIARLNLKHKKLLKIEEEAELLLKISRLGYALRKSVASFDFDGFVSGKMTGLLNLQK